MNPSGDFTPTLDSFGRVIFTRWARVFFGAIVTIARTRRPRRAERALRPRAAAGWGERQLAGHALWRRPRCVEHPSGTGMQRTPRALRHVYVLLVVMLGWVFFRAETLGGAVGYLEALVTPGHGDVEEAAIESFPASDPLAVDNSCRDCPCASLADRDNAVNRALPVPRVRRSTMLAVYPRLCAWYSDSLLADVEALLARGERRAAALAAVEGAVVLDVATVASVAEDAMYARYRLSNPTATDRDATLFVALRPFQVNPPRQFLNTPGGATRMTCRPAPSAGPTPCRSSSTT